MVGPAVGRAKKKKQKEEKAPWLKQKLVMTEDGWMGVHVDPHQKLGLRESASRSEKGAWRDQEEYRRAYTLNVREAGKQPLIGSYLAVDAALRLLEAAKEENQKPLAHGIFHPTPPPGLLPHHQLHFKDDIDIVWCRGSGCYAPRSGCMIRHGEWDDKRAGEPYQPFLKWQDKAALPLFLLKEESLTEEEQKIVDAFVVDNIDTGAIRPWSFEEGLPTVVSRLKIVYKHVPALDGTMTEKPRLVCDFRYANGLSQNHAIHLPSTVEFAQNVPRGHLIAKMDAKGGFHQCQTDPSHEHMLAVHWRGRVFAYTCMGFGLRSGPDIYTAKTQQASREAVSALRAKSLPCPSQEDVFVDDFFQSWERASHVEPFIKEIIKRGVVLGKDKCVEALAVQEVLGIVVDTVVCQCRKRRWICWSLKLVPCCEITNPHLAVT